MTLGVVERAYTVGGQLSDLETEISRWTRNHYVFLRITLPSIWSMRSCHLPVVSTPTRLRKCPNARCPERDSTYTKPNTPLTHTRHTHTRHTDTDAHAHNTHTDTAPNTTPHPAHANLSINPLLTLKFTTPPTPKAGTIRHILAAVLSAQFLPTAANRSRHPPSTSGRL